VAISNSASPEIIWGLGGPEEDHQFHHCCWTGRVEGPQYTQGMYARIIRILCFLYLSVFHVFCIYRYSMFSVSIGIPCFLYLSVFHVFCIFRYSMFSVSIGIPCFLYLSVFHVFCIYRYSIYQGLTTCWAGFLLSMLDDIYKY